MIQQILSPVISSNTSSNDTTLPSSTNYPSITPFVPTPDDIAADRYCHLEVNNKGVCPLCEAKVKLKSTSEAENIWQVEYDGSIVLDWQPLVSSSKCMGVVLKVVTWDEMAAMHDVIDCLLYTSDAADE